MMHPDISKIKIGDIYLYLDEIVTIEDITPCEWKEMSIRESWVADECYHCVGKKIVNGIEGCYTSIGVSKFVIIEEDFFKEEEFEI